MRRTRVMVVLAGTVAASCAASLAVMAAPAVGAVARADSWGKAIEVPGLARLSAGHGGTLVAVSCSSAGNCSAGGNYDNRSGHGQAYVVSEKNGSWGTAIEVPRLATLNTGGHAQVTSLSCASAGNCAAGGFYTSSRGTRAFVVSEKNGSWGRAIEVPGLAALNTSMSAGVGSVSCASAGNCAVAGTYRANAPEAFFVSEKNGSWGTAIEVPGSAAFGVATVASVSCASAGNCAAAGFSGSITNDAPSGPLVASEKNGTWSNVIAVAGTTASARNSAGSVSCGSVNYCAAGGSFAPSIEGPYQAFVVREKNGSWGTAIEVPGLAALNVGGSADVESVSCGQARYCAAGGTYRDGNGYQQAFVVSDINGAWGTAIEVPGSAALNTGGSAQITSVSCTSARYCVAAGDYTELSGNGGAFLVSRT
jgi:hypothetical protein